MCLQSRFASKVRFMMILYRLYGGDNDVSDSVRHTAISIFGMLLFDFFVRTYTHCPLACVYSVRTVTISPL